MTKEIALQKIAAELSKLATKGDDYWGTGEQIDEENAIYEYMESVMPEIDYRRMEHYLLKATSDEGLDYAKKYLTGELNPHHEYLSQLFNEELREELPAKTFELMVKRHIAEGYANKNVCVTHEYCDANMVMLNAWMRIHPEPENFLDYSVFVDECNKAWGFSKRHNFQN